MQKITQVVHLAIKVLGLAIKVLGRFRVVAIEEVWILIKLKNVEGFLSQVSCFFPSANCCQLLEVFSRGEMVGLEIYGQVPIRKSFFSWPVTGQPTTPPKVPPPKKIRPYDQGLSTIGFP